MEKDFKIERGKWYFCIKTFIYDSKTVVRKGHVYRSDNGNSIHGDSGRLFIANHDGKAAEYFRPWTIGDAKDGDILVWDDCGDLYIFIYKNIHNGEYAEAYCGLNVYLNKFETGVTENHYYCLDFIFPATVGQIEQLFNVMRQAGYEWDEKKKQLNEIVKSVQKNEAGNGNLTEFENAVLEILDFTARAVLKNQKMPKWERLEQLSREWSVGLLEKARKQIVSEVDVEKLKKEAERQKTFPMVTFMYGVTDTLKAIKGE